MATKRKAKSASADEKRLTAEEFDAKFDAGEDMSEHLDLDNAVFKVNVDFPAWMVKALDAEADRLGIARQAIIKTLVDDGLKRASFERRGLSPDVVRQMLKDLDAIVVSADARGIAVGTTLADKDEPAPSRRKA